MKYYFSVLIMLLANLAFADIHIPRIFTNAMVLQCNKKVCIWGRADKNAKVRIEFANQKIITKANENGEWLLYLNPMTASNEGRRMLILENGKTKRIIENVLVGEVWVVAGESNMTHPLRNMENSALAIKSANNSLIRYFNQGGAPFIRSISGLGSKPEFDTPRGTGWLICSPKNAEYSFKALPYLFAKDLAATLDVPIGIIYTPISTSRMMSWVDKDNYENNPAFAKSKKLYQKRLSQYDYKSTLKNFEASLKDYKQSLANAKEDGNNKYSKKYVGEWMRPWKDSPDGWASPSMLYNLRINPIRHLTISGVIWSQNTTEFLDYKNYYNMLDAFIAIWRKTFSNKDLPFVFLQAPSNDDELSPSIRVQQQLLSEVVDNTYMIESIDTSIKSSDVKTDNYTIAKRYANTVLSNVYGKKGIKTTPPTVSAINFNTNVATIFIKGATKLKQKGDLRGFEALVEGKWIPAKAKIADTKIIITIDRNKKLEGARYLFYPNTKADVCIYNEHDIPLSPFVKRVAKNQPAVKNEKVVEKSI